MLPVKQGDDIVDVEEKEEEVVSEEAVDARDRVKTEFLKRCREVPIS